VRISSQAICAFRFSRFAHFVASDLRISLRMICAFRCNRFAHFVASDVRILFRLIHAFRFSRFAHFDASDLRIWSQPARPSLRDGRGGSVLGVDSGPDGGFKIFAGC
jgi:hypothetical protein